MKEAYRNLFDQVNPPAGFQEKVFARMEPKPRKRRIPRPLGAVTAVLVVFLLATPVMAAYVPEITDLMYAIAPEIAARFSPVQESCEKNGIRMEVVATSVHGNQVELYLGFTDLEGKNRIDLNTHPDMVMFHAKPFLNGFGGFSGSAITDPMRYDPESGTYYSMTERTVKAYSKWKKRYLTIREIFGNKLTATVDSLSRYVDKENVELPLILKEQETMTLTLDEHGGFTDKRFKMFGREGGGSLESPWYQKKSYDVLTLGEVIQSINEELAVTGTTYIDGELRVQVRRQRLDENVTSRYGISLNGRNGEQVNSDRATLVDIERDGKRISYKEYYFKIPEKDLGNYTMLFDLSEEQIIKGPWRVTFPLVESDYADEEQGRDTPNVRRENGYVIIEEAAVG